MIFHYSEIQRAAEKIQHGELIAFPTETVYGLGASVFLPPAIYKIFEVKGRPQDNPLIVHISDLEQLEMIVKELPENFHLLAQAFFPGPLTVLLPKKESVPALVSANLPTIGVRMPAHPIARQLIRAVEAPLVAPSANLSGRPSSTTAQHVLEDFGNKIAGVIDGGACQYGIESTVLTLVPKPVILRPGAISQAQIESILKCHVPYAEEQMEKPLSPGMKYRHYAPRARVKVIYSSSSIPSSHNQVILSSFPSNQLYALLRQADADDKEEIVIVCDEEMQKDSALMNRIMRASQ